MTYMQQQKFESLNNKVIDYLNEQGFNTFFNNTIKVKEMYNDAKRINRLNNDLIKSNDYESVVKFMSGLDLKTNQVVSFNLHPNKENTIERIFIYLVLESQYSPKQMYSHFKNKPL